MFAYAEAEEDVRRERVADTMYKKDRAGQVSEHVGKKHDVEGRKKGICTDGQRRLRL